MLFHNQLTDRQVRQFIRQGQIVFGGHRKLKIYGTLRCGSGRRMKRDNRVFFQSQHKHWTQGFVLVGMA